jgi:hypothetical protein
LHALAGRAGSGLQLVVVAGPPGVGKSALVATLAGGLDESWSPVWCHCDHRERTVPLAPFRRRFTALFERDTQPTTDQLARELERCVDGRRPLLVVEDFHDADPSTLDALGELPALLPTGLLAMTSRSVTPLELGGDLVPCIVLAPLDPGMARTLARNRAGARRLPSATANEIAARSGGIPLYVLALTDAVTAAHDPAVDEQADIPASLYDSLMARLDQLGPVGDLARRCAVLGDGFSPADLAMLSDDGADQDAAGLAELVDAGVLVAEDGGTYRMAHSLLAQAAYESLLNADRTALHARIADTLPARLARAEPERLAYHLEGCGRTFDAAVAWRRASGQANTHNRFREAQQHARRAVALFDEIGPGGWSDGGVNRGRALVNLAVSTHGLDRGSAELTEVIEQARRSAVADESALTIGLTDIGNRQALGDFRGALDVARRTCEIVIPTGDDEAISLARHYLGATLTWRGHLVEASAELREAIEHRERRARAAWGTGSLSWSLLALTAAMEDRLDEAEQAFERAHACLPPEAPFIECTLREMIAVVDQLAGRAAKVRSEMEPVWSRAAELGSDVRVTWAQVLLGWAIAEVDPPSGLGMMSEAIDASTTRQFIPYALQLFGCRMCEQGQVAAGLARLEAGVALATETGEELWVPGLQLERARWLAADDQTGAAQAAWAEALTRAAAMGAHLLVRNVRRDLRAVGQRR